MAKAKGRKENLHPFGTRAEEVERAVRSKGGLARAANIREGKTIRQLLKHINEEEVDVMINGELVKAIRKIKPLLALQQKAEEGDVAATREWAKLQGEYEEKVTVEADVKAENNIALEGIDHEALAKFILDTKR